MSFISVVSKSFVVVVVQTGPTDLRHFDPTLTCIPPTLSDLVTTERSLHVADFDYVAPDEIVSPSGKTICKNSPDALFREESVQPTTLEVVCGGGSPDKDAESALPLENSTDEEKVMVRSKAGGSAGGLEVAVGVGVSPQEEGMFVQGSAPSYGLDIVVSAEINQS